MKKQKKILEIDKKELPKIKFSQIESLKNKSRKIYSEKRQLIKVAVSSKDNVTIIIKSLKRELIKIVAPILHTGRDYIMVKGGYMIPINSIVKIQL